jgi:hypothetical protein
MAFRNSYAGVPEEMSHKTRRFLDANAFEMFVNDTNGRVQVQCCRKVAEVVERLPATATTQAHKKLGDTCEAVVRVFENHAASSATVSTASRAVAALASSSPKVRAKLLQERALAAIGGALARHGVSRPDLAVNACLAVAAMIGGNSGVRSTGGGVYAPLAHAASRPHAPAAARTSRSRRPRSGPRSEAWLQLGSHNVYGGCGPEATAALRRALQIGLPNAVAAAMRAHVDDRYVQVAALQALLSMVEMSALVEREQRHARAGAIDPPLGWRRSPANLGASAALMPDERLRLRAAARLRSLGEALGVDALAAVDAADAASRAGGAKAAAATKDARASGDAVDGDVSGASETKESNEAPPAPHVAARGKLRTLLLLGGKGLAGNSEGGEAPAREGAEEATGAESDSAALALPSASGAMEAERVDCADLILSLSRAGAIKHVVALVVGMSAVARDGAVQLGCCRVLAAVWRCAVEVPRSTALRIAAFPERAVRAVRFALPHEMRQLDAATRAQHAPARGGEAEDEGHGGYVASPDSFDSVGLVDLRGIAVLPAASGAPASAGALPRGQIDPHTILGAARDAFDAARAVARERTHARLGRRRCCAVRIVLDVDGGTDRLLLRATLLDAGDVERKCAAAEEAALRCSKDACAATEALYDSVVDEIDALVEVEAEKLKVEEAAFPEIKLVWGAESEEALAPPIEEPPGLSHRERIKFRQKQTERKIPDNPMKHRDVATAFDEWGHVATQTAPMKWNSAVSSAFDTSRVIYIRVHAASPRVFIGVAHADWDMAGGPAKDELPWEAPLVAGYTGFGNMCSCGDIVAKSKAKLAAADVEASYYGVAVELWVNLYTRSVDVLVEGEWQGTVNLDAGSERVRLVATLYEEGQQCRIEGWEDWTTPEEYALAAGIVTADQVGKGGLDMAYLEARAAAEALDLKRRAAWKSERLQRRRTRRAMQSRNRYHEIVRTPVRIAAQAPHTASRVGYRPSSVSTAARPSTSSSTSTRPRTRPGTSRSKPARMTSATTRRYELRTDLDEYLVRLTLRRGGGCVRVPREGFTAADAVDTADIPGHLTLWPHRPDRMAHGEVVFDGIVAVHATTPQDALRVACAPHALVLRPSYIPARLADVARECFRDAGVALHGDAVPAHALGPIWGGGTKASDVPPQRSLIVDVPPAACALVVERAAAAAQEVASHRLQPFIDRLIEGEADRIDPPFAFAVSDVELVAGEDLRTLGMSAVERAALVPASEPAPLRLGFADDEDLAERLGDEATHAAEENLAAHIASAHDRRQKTRDEIGGDGAGRERSLLGADVDDADAFEQLDSLGGSLRARLAESNALYVAAEKAVEGHFEQEAEWLIKQGLAAQAAREANLPAARRAAKEKREREKREKREKRAARAQMNGTEESESTDSEEEAARQRAEEVRSPSPVVDMAAVAAALEKEMIVARVARGKARRSLAAAEVFWARSTIEDTETEVRRECRPRALL